ncbi:PP0621 family protein [Herminiimonas sp. CN]|uniref:PP0621 family protein n=1 Tax=Herminiimonas sp. CN TaxID=1349818 RepID=UPI000473091C|nr:PP0621 family protein [Herminiimonas sp. CN]
MRLLAWLLLGLLVVWAIRSKKSAMHEGKTEVPRLEEPELMVPCMHCGVHFPASEAVSQAGMSFCSEEHRRLHFPS